MDNKLGTQLMLSLDTDVLTREKSYELNIGYDKAFRLWELIIRYTGELETLLEDYGLIGTKLLGGFAIVAIREDKIREFALDNRVIYIEQPKAFVVNRASIAGFNQSCMSVPYFDMNLRGNGIYVAIIDSGIDIYHPDFFIEDNGIKYTKIAALWDQTQDGNPPYGYNVGTLYTREDINVLINSESNNIYQEELGSNSMSISRDISGHGTAVAGIVAACTPSAQLIIVKLDTSGREETDTISLMLGIDFAVRFAIDNSVPLVVNLSYGNNSGDHNGNSVLERYIDAVSVMAKSTFVVGAGNDGASGGHVQINMGNESWYKREFFVNQGESGISILVWRKTQDVADIFLTTPNGNVIGPFNDYDNIMTYQLEDMVVKVINSGPTPINVMQETYISIIPIDGFIMEGVWSISFNPKRIIDGRFDVWLPVSGSTNSEVYFLTPTASTTLTIPATAENVITVGAYNQNTFSFAPFSGRGYTVDGNVKPDILAPGVNIDTASAGGGYELVTGTSFATPFVSSAAAMLMEYGIVNGNDLFLYGEKVKAYLIAAAKPLLDFNSYPNNQSGWGALCVV